ncbi:hypothetical protein CWC20_14425 [Pseudoalteromonas aurantia]|uniref:Uncharacterized protein n=1 Tax=Pseudoalteromonas aurantia TaxID=43654 RepID=A0A5S3VE84_9GAMM|nr:hypothetical protein CWC19_00060 [Pseudoalteromonas aurantia]TMO72845.1 hypothetical protein CWC20_14425 [Pseudoalteromonas aurantia]
MLSTLKTLALTALLTFTTVSVNASEKNNINEQSVNVGINLIIPMCTSFPRCEPDNNSKKG